MGEMRLVTAEELLVMGEGRREFVEGRVVDLSPEGFRHSVVTARIASRLLDFVDKAGAGLVVGPDTGFVLARSPDTVRAPDGAFTSAARLDGVDLAGYLPFAPDLAVEVVSPDDSFTAVETRARMWLAHGTRIVWVADPGTRRVYVYLADGSRTVHDEDGTLDGGDVLPGLALSVARCF
jgi:Uma2 family endonuclease